MKARMRDNGVELLAENQDEHRTLKALLVSGIEVADVGIQQSVVAGFASNLHDPTLTVTVRAKTQ